MKKALTKTIAMIMVVCLFVGCSLKAENEVESDPVPLVLNTRADLSDLFHYDFSNVELYDVRALHIAQKGSSDPLSTVGVIFKKPEKGCLDVDHECEFCDKPSVERKDPFRVLGDIYMADVYYQMFSEWYMGETLDKTVEHMGTWGQGYRKFIRNDDGEKLGEVASQTSVCWAVSKLDHYKNKTPEDEYVIMVIADLLHFVTIGDIQNELIEVDLPQE